MTPIYKLYAELVDSDPKIWRRFVVHESTTMTLLGCIIMSIFNMKAWHPFRFDVISNETLVKRVKHIYTNDAYNKIFPVENDSSFEKLIHFELITDELFYEPNIEQIIDAEGYEIKDAISEPGDWMNFYYDYGDGWCVHVVLESVFDDIRVQKRNLPSIIEGEGFGIIEGTGGMIRLQEFAKEYEKKDGYGFDDFLEFSEIDDFDLSFFDIADRGRKLKKEARYFQNCYEEYRPLSGRNKDMLGSRYRKKKNE